MTVTADLSPPLGKPSGPCQIVRRIDKEVKNPALKRTLIDEVQEGEDLTNQEASKVYTPISESGVGFIRQIRLTSHGQYRMDLRGITVDDLRRSVGSLVAQVELWKKLGNPGAARMIEMFERGDKIEWMDPKTKLKVVLQPSGTDTVTLVSTFWKGQPDPGPVQTCERVARRYLSLFVVKPVDQTL